VIAEESQLLRNISNKDRAPVEFEEMAIEAQVSFLYPFKAVGRVQLNKRERDT
jgi:hypothetical protein